MYTKDLTEKMTLRFTKEQMGFINELSDKQGISNSDFVRQCVDFMIVTSAMTERVIESVDKKKADKAKKTESNKTDSKSDKIDKEPSKKAANPAKRQTKKTVKE